MSLATIQSGVAQGVMWAILTLGVYLTFRTLEIADLTVEGTFPLGAAVTVVLINAGVHPIVAATAAFISGMCAGLVSGGTDHRIQDPSHTFGDTDTDSPLFRKYTDNE